MNKPHSSLRYALASALAQRVAAMRSGRSHRKDHDRVNDAIMRVQTFLQSYPVASDWRVRAWCIENMEHVAILVPGHTPRALARLVMDSLEADAKVSDLVRNIDAE